MIRTGFPFASGIALALLAMPSAAAAAAHGPAPKRAPAPAHAPADAHAPAPAGPGNVTMPPILAPLVVDGRLQGYAYLTITLTPRARDKMLAIREKMPVLQDGFLRELNRGSFAKADDPKAFDAEAAKTRLLARANAILPAGTVSDVRFDAVVMQALQQQ